MGKLLKAKDVAELLDVDGSTVRGWIKDGKLPAILTPGGQYRIDPRAVDALMAQIGRSVSPPAELVA
jgi:excisionase family DNA binding protein